MVKSREKSCYSRDIAARYKLEGNEHELKSACLNLVSNAIAYTPQNGDIDVILAS